METQPVGAESIRLDVVKRMFAAFDVDLAETRNERTNELLASMMAGLLSGEGSIPADLVRRALAAYGVDVAEKKIPCLYYGNCTLLQKAVCDGDAEMVAASAAVGCDVDAEWYAFAFDRFPTSAIHYLAKPFLEDSNAGTVDILRVLLAAGADPNKIIPRFEISPLAAVARYEDPSCVRLLLAAGADVNGGGGRPPLFEAIDKGRVQTLRLLVAAGANTNVMFKKETPLRAAIISGRPAVVQVFIDAGVDVNARADEYSRSPLKQALCRGHRNCLEPLLRAGATIDDVMLFSRYRSEKNDSAWRYMERVQAAGGYAQLVLTYRRVLTAPRSCLVKYLELRFGRPAPADLVPSVLGFWKPPGGG